MAVARITTMRLMSEYVRPRAVGNKPQVESCNNMAHVIKAVIHKTKTMAHMVRLRVSCLAASRF